MKPPQSPKKRSLKKTIIIVGVIIGLCALIGAISQLTMSPENKTATQVARAAQTVIQNTAQAEKTAQKEAELGTATAASAEKRSQAATLTAAPTNTPKPPTNTPIPTEPPTNTPTNTPAPVVLTGSGQTATQSITPPSVVSAVSLTHSGSANFIVYAYQGSEKTLLVNKIGTYNGTRPLFGDDPVEFDIQADGPWTITVTAMDDGAQPTFSGKGDAVSAVFDPPGQGAWEISHDGQANFIVKLHCAGGSNLIQNVIGPVSGSQIVNFPQGPCFWEVQADGNWDMKPRSPIASGSFAPGGLGLSQQVWEQTHTKSSEDLGYIKYDSDQYWVLFMEQKVWHLERDFTNTQPTLDEARMESSLLIPEDSQLVETYHPEGVPELTVDLYLSESLKACFPSDNWIGGEPGNFVVIFGVFDGRVSRMVIGTGNNP